MATPLKKQFILDPQTLLERGKCHDCGKPVMWLVAKSGVAYYNCYNSFDDGYPCQGHHRKGGYLSCNLRKAYLIKHGKIQPVKMAAPTPADAENATKPPIRAVPTDTQPAPQAEPKPTKKSDYEEYGI